MPNLKSTNEFICDAAYLGDIKIDLVSKYETPSPALLLRACTNVLGKVADYIIGIEETYIGTIDDGGRFEPDYVLFQHKDKVEGFEQLQVFIEPKGTHLLENDAWYEGIYR